MQELRMAVEELLELKNGLVGVQIGSNINNKTLMSQNFSLGACEN